MFRKIRKIIGTTILVLFIIALVFVLFARISGTTPSLFGYSLLRVETGSMEPELKVGNILLVQKIEDPSTLKKGDVITYYGQETPVKGSLVTHQIYEEPREENGKYYFITKGLRNTLPDPEFDDSQLFGEVKYKIPLLGTLYDFFSKPFGLIAFAAVMLIAFSAELINLINIIRNKEEEVDHEVPVTAAEPVYKTDFEESIEQETNEIITDLEDGL
ncbi:MAG: signal peptidase I [Ruminococcaceae bacterium]|nr:signal peptidase I [Oscillospiraceae bacterium]